MIKILKFFLGRIFNFFGGKNINFEENIYPWENSVESFEYFEIESKFKGLSSK